MKKIINFAIFLFLYNSIANAFPYTLPIGEYWYKGHLITENIRTTESLDHNTLIGQERLNELKRLDFTCLRKNQNKTICSHETGPQKTPDFLYAPVMQKLKNDPFIFASVIETPSSVQDTFTEHRYLVKSDVKLLGQKIQNYQFVYYYENQRQVLTFPINENQPVGYLDWIRGQLGLTIVLTQKKEQQTVGYILKAFYKPDSSGSRTAQ